MLRMLSIYCPIMSLTSQFVLSCPWVDSIDSKSIGRRQCYISTLEMFDYDSTRCRGPRPRHPLECGLLKLGRVSPLRLAKDKDWLSFKTPWISLQAGEVKSFSTFDADGKFPSPRPASAILQQWEWCTSARGEIPQYLICSSLTKSTCGCWGLSGWKVS